MEYLNSGISEEETLQVALQSGIIDINEISMRIEDMKRKEKKSYQITLILYGIVKQIIFGKHICLI